MLTLSTEIEKINKVGAITAKRLKKLGIKSIKDLLCHFPFRYDDFRAITLIENLKPGTKANIVGQIELIQSKRSPRKRINIIEALVSDSTESVKIIWFNQPFIARNLKIGDKVSLTGKIENDYSGLLMKSPAYEKITGGQTMHTQGLVSNYHLTANLTQKQIRFLVRQAINLSYQIPDWLPMEIIKTQKLLNLGEAIRKIHFPQNQNDIEQAKKRLSFNEFFLIQLQSQFIRKDTKSCVSMNVSFLEKETKNFVNSLPFKLTPAQKKAAWEILQDMQKEKPMTRLLEGDVGSGKTVVAVIAMLNVALSKQQAVLMVPTEILASQHFNNISRLLKNFNIKIGLVTRNEKRLANAGRLPKNKMLDKIKNGKISIIIGTHALIQQDVKFKNLGLAIIDEQHRFGVEQRKALIEKSGRENEKLFPHLLSMTATPIPRSLALALYGDLDISIINQMPSGRKQIITKIVPEKKREPAYGFIKKQIKEGQQAFVICPLIDFSDKLGVKSVKEEFKKLNQNIFPDLKIAMLHGKLKPTEKNKIMRDFLDKKINILVSTSVVEVGIDAPNAAIMMIEGADRFGLAQLHQFRGRVGRSRHQSYCFLFSDANSQKTIDRLSALEKCDNGFELAKMDLKFRGPGEVYGISQKGFPELKVASLFDYELMKNAHDEAKKIIEKNFSLNSWPKLKDKINDWQRVSRLE